MAERTHLSELHKKVLAFLAREERAVIIREVMDALGIEYNQRHRDRVSRALRYLERKGYIHRIAFRKWVFGKQTEAARKGPYRSQFSQTGRKTEPAVPPVPVLQTEDVKRFIPAPFAPEIPPPDLLEIIHWTDMLLNELKAPLDMPRLMRISYAIAVIQTAKGLKT